MADFNSAGSIVGSPKEEILGGDYLCSCCLATGNLRNMLHKIDNGGKMENYYEMMWNCYDSQILCSDNPTNEYYICDKCIARLTDSYLFKLQVIEAQRALQGLTREQENAQENLSKKHLEPINFFSMDESVVKIECQGDIECNDNGDIFKNDEDLTYYQPSVSANRTSSKSKRAKAATDAPKSPAIRSNPPESEGSRLHFLLTRAVAESAASENLPTKRNRKDRSGTREAKRNPEEIKSKIGIEVKSIAADGRHLKCKACSKEFRSAKVLERHSRVHEERTCPKCGRTFPNQRKFENHYGGHTKRLSACQRCGLRFPTVWQRQKHLRDFHGDHMFVCQYCAAEYLSMGLLHVHLREKHLPPGDMLQCDHCAKQFHQKSRLVRHMVMHMGQRTHACHICHKAFARRKTLQQHAKIHDDVKNHECNFCGMRFVQKASLNWHLKKHTLIH